MCTRAAFVLARVVVNVAYVFFCVSMFYVSARTYFLFVRMCHTGFKLIVCNKCFLLRAHQIFEGIPYTRDSQP